MEDSLVPTLQRGNERYGFGFMPCFWPPLLQELIGQTKHFE